MTTHPLTYPRTQPLSSPFVSSNPPTNPHIHSPFSLRTLLIIIQAFEELGATERAVCFGSYRVELVVSLFHRVVDLHNFELVAQKNILHTL